MKLNVLYELSIIGDAYREASNEGQTGIYRVAFELLSRLHLFDEVQLYGVNCGHQYSKCQTQDLNRFLTDHEIAMPLANDRKRIKFLPFRKEKLFKYLYRQLGITDYRNSWNQEILNNAQIYHSVYYPVPAVIKEIPHLKKIVTVHDLIPILYPQYNSNTALLQEVIRSIEDDGYAICVSENTKKDLLRYAPKLDPSRVFVSLLAASKELFYPCSNEQRFREVQQKYNLPKRYFLSLSTLEPRKNIDHIIRCFTKMVDENHIEDLYLVLVGAKGWNYDKIFEEHENAEHLKEKIIFTGRVPNHDLAAIYSHAQAFFYMSFYEGFGLPPLEAMQCGLPVVTSNSSSLPEVVGDAGILLEPTDELGLVRCMQDLYSDADLRNALKEKSLQRSSIFSWDITTKQHLEIYKQVCSIQSKTQ